MSLEKRIEQARALAQSIRNRRDRRLTRSAKACFCDPASGELTEEAAHLFVDLRQQAKLFGTSIGSAAAPIDPLELARIEGRREIVLRLINFVQADPLRIARLVEVDDGRE